MKHPTVALLIALCATSMASARPAKQKSPAFRIADVITMASVNLIEVKQKPVALTIAPLNPRNKDVKCR
jgi:hypothetical protein